MNNLIISKNLDPILDELLNQEDREITIKQFNNGCQSQGLTTKLHPNGITYGFDEVEFKEFSELTQDEHLGLWAIGEKVRFIIYGD